MLQTPPRRMSLIALVHAGNGTGLPGSWRHPEAATDYTSATYYSRMARTLESACFDLAFFEDRYTVPHTYLGSAAPALRQGIGALRLDPQVAAQAMGLATERLGIGLPISPARHHPLPVARTLSSLDLMLGGRLAWHLSAARGSHSRRRSTGRPAVDPTHTLRADEFLQVVQGHWSSWDSGAQVMDREQGVFADPDHIHSLQHQGPFFSSHGPFTLPRSAQGTPVLLQDMVGGYDMNAAARHAELSFARFPNLAVASWAHAKFKSLVAEAGRDPCQVRVAPMVHTVVGVTRWMAEDKLALLNSLSSSQDTLVLLSEALQIDLGARADDQPFTADELADNDCLRMVCERVAAMTGNPLVTLADLLRHDRTGTVGELPTFVGTPSEIANEMQAWFGTAADGFVIAPTHVPGGFEDFARLVVPQLQRRGLFRTRYEARTLRGHLGLPLPASAEALATG